MNKYSIFTLFLAGLMMVITTELLVDKYAGIQTTFRADILTTDTLEKQNETPVTPIVTNTQPTQQNISPSSEQQTIQVSLITPLTVTPPVQTQILTVSEPSTSITFSLIQKAGFEGINLQRVSFDGNLFDKLSIKDNVKIPVIVQNLLKNNSFKVATFYEFQSKSHLIAEQVYGLLKTKFSNLTGTGVNETNEVGENSFYVNFLPKSTDVFLVVKKGTGVYALSYQKESHPFIEKLLQLLP